MAERQKLYVHLSSLISQARLKKGYTTLKELYREKRPQIDYQTWLNAESGRRIPSASVVISIADTLEIDHQATILAYCRDKFPLEKSQHALDTLSVNKFIDIDTLINAEEHNRSKEYVFTADELEEMKRDNRLHHYLTYEYDDNSETTREQLADFFGDTMEEVEKITAKLVSLKLLQIDNDRLKKFISTHRFHGLPTISVSERVYCSKIWNVRLNPVAISPTTISA